MWQHHWQVKDRFRNGINNIEISCKHIGECWHLLYNMLLHVQFVSQALATDTLLKLLHTSEKKVQIYCSV